MQVNRNTKAVVTGGMEVAGPAPKWATDLLLHIADDLGPRYRVRRLEWSRYKSTHSGGMAYSGRRIRMRAGSDRQEQRIVLLHELAHVAASITANHDREMYRIAWHLWRTYAPGIKVQTIFEREGQYRTTCLSVAKELGIRGARAALSERRKANATSAWRHRHVYEMVKIEWQPYQTGGGYWVRFEHCTKLVGPYSDGTMAACGMNRSSHTFTPPTEAEQAYVVA